MFRFEVSPGFDNIWFSTYFCHLSHEATSSFPQYSFWSNFSPLYPLQFGQGVCCQGGLADRLLTPVLSPVQSQYFKQLPRNQWKSPRPLRCYVSILFSQAWDSRSLASYSPPPPGLTGTLRPPFTDTPHALPAPPITPWMQARPGAVRPQEVNSLGITRRNSVITPTPPNSPGVIRRTPHPVTPSVAPREQHDQDTSAGSESVFTSTSAEESITSIHSSFTSLDSTVPASSAAVFCDPDQQEALIAALTRHRRTSSDPGADFSPEIVH